MTDQTEPRIFVPQCLQKTAEVAAWMASASQISTWTSCQRKWYFEKVLNLFRPEHPSAELGTRCHAALEKYVETGIREGADDVMRILAVVWEQPWLLALVKNPLAHVEYKVEGLFIGGIGINGRIDLEYRSAPMEGELKIENLPVPVAGGSTKIIIDHKSTGNFAYAKTAETALGDPQTVIYGASAFLDPEITEVIFVYHYFRTKAPTILPRCVIVRHTRETLAPFLQKFEAFLDEMRQMRDHPLAAIPRNTDACWDFGGCPFRAACYEQNENQMTQEQVTMATGIDFEGLLNNFAGAQPAAKPKEAFVPPTGEPVRATPPAPEALKPPKVKDDRPTLFPAMAGNGRGLPIVLFGCVMPGVNHVDLEEVAEPFIQQWQRANKDTHYLNSDFFKAERAIAVMVISAMARGEIEIPDVLYVRTDSPIGKYFRAEMRLIKDKVRQVIPAG
jgi:hypothetical protein